MEASPITQPDLEHTATVGAPPTDAWTVIADVTRTPEWSPVVKRCEWTNGASGPEKGAAFRGHNRFNGFRWTRDCLVTEAEPAKVFAFSTFGKDGQEQTRWRYTLEPTEGGTQVTLAYEIVTVPRWVRFVRALPGGRRTNERQARQNLEQSLERLGELLAGGDVR